MRTKKFAVIIVAVVFVLVMLFSCIALFAVKKVEVKYAVGNGRETLEIQQRLDEFLGDNLIFVKKDEVKESLTDFHYMEVLSVEKKFPNVIKVEILERREVYQIISGENAYITTENGLVLKSNPLSAQVESRDRISLELNDIVVNEATLGTVLKTDADELLAQVFEMAKSVQLTNCIQSVVVEKAPEFNGKATFKTYTGVDIVIRTPLEDGVKKIETAFNKYESATDYEKTFKHIEVIKGQSGELEAWWINEKE